jgi:hypothetical protein
MRMRGCRCPERSLAMPETTRITVQEARKKVVASQAMLVCAYEDPQKCRANNLEGSLAFQDFQNRQPGKQQEVIFYCA